MSRRRIFQILAGAAGLLLTALVFPKLFERVEETEDRGYSGEAAVHSYFALKELLRGLGVPTRVLGNLRQLPPRDHALWIAAPQRGTAEQRLVEWAAAGGHLLVIPALDDEGEDPLLAELGVASFQEDQADDDDHLSRPEFATDRPEWPRLYAGEGIEVLHSEGAPDAAWLLTVAVGEGLATIFSDGAFLRNDHLGERDHALVAWRAVSWDGPPAGLWLVYRDPPPSVWTVLTARAKPLALSLAVLCVAALLFLARRFGPILEPEHRHQRHLAEHVRAVGDYLWGVRCEDALLTAQRRALGRHLARGATAHGSAPDDEQLLELALHAAPSAGLSEDQVREALTVRETRERPIFTRIVHTLETLRRSS